MKPSFQAPHSLLSRREFLQATALSLGGLAVRPWSLLPNPLPDNSANRLSPRLSFPEGEKLGRVIGGKVPVKKRPDIDSPEVKVLFDDEIVVWLRETVGSRPLWYSQTFVETPDGYIYAPNLQPVRHQPNPPLKVLPDPEGMWVEVSVPYIDLVLQGKAKAPWLEHTSSPRLYYNQIMWVDAIKIDDQGQTWYQVKERYGTFGDVFLVPAEALRPLTAEDLSPISPGVEDKRVVVNLSEQTLGCYEGQREVYFCRVSTGGKWDAEGNPSATWATPVGPHSIWRKLVSVHMTGGSTGGGYDLPGIGWTTLFSGNGVAIHSTFWHNSFGVPKSHGCVNARPEDAQWVFRWTNPGVEYNPGDITISGTTSTKVVIMERA